MLPKKMKAAVASILTVAMTTNVFAATVVPASAAGTRTKANKYGDSTYAQRFMSLYDDVITNGQTNGYLSQNDGGSGSFGIPYHSREEVIIEAPDYGHETTSEAMSYLVWVAAMHDNIVKNSGENFSGASANDLQKAWKTMEVMIPDVQDNFWQSSSVSAQYCGEYDTPDQCPGAWAGEASKTAENPIFNKFTRVYSGKNNQGGLYLMHWLADVDNWYGFGEGTEFTFINTFQRGEQESCWETVPFPCVEEKKYGNSQQGLKGIFNRDTTVTNQWAYTNAPDAEDRAIQGVYDAIKWNVSNSTVNAKAAEMGDELRNNMYDKYYQQISQNTSWTNGNAGDNSKHYLMNWYTSWGGALKGTGQNWCWQIGCSHAHEFYQNPLAAYALLTDLSSGMKADGAKQDYQKSLERQLEFYLWLQSKDGPIAGGATNSYKGRYETYPSGVPTFYGMMYVEHPVYADPGSNHWTGNQVWAVQRLAELYYWVKQNGGDNTGVRPGGMSMEAALEQILDKWCAWFVNNTVLTSDGDFYMPSNLDWQGQPDSWNGSATSNSGLSCTISGYGNTDLGCVSSLANTLLYYAKAKGVKGSDISGMTYSSVGGKFNYNIEGATNVKAGTKTYTANDSALPKASLYLAKELIDRSWALGRDDLGMSRTEHNPSLARFFSQTVWIPENYNGTMPNGDKLANGATFESIRTMYEGNCAGAPTSTEAINLVKELKAAYNKDVQNGAKWDSKYSASDPEGQAQIAGFKNVAKVDLNYHRFWHAGDDMMALGVMANLYGNELTPPTDDKTYPTNIKVTYSEQYHQMRFTWDKVKNADKYGIAVYLAGKWRIQTSNITTNSYTSPKNMTPGMSYKVAIAARVNGTWDVVNALKYSVVNVTVK